MKPNKHNVLHTSKWSFGGEKGGMWETGIRSAENVVLTELHTKTVIPLLWHSA